MTENRKKEVCFQMATMLKVSGLLVVTLVVVVTLLAWGTGSNAAEANEAPRALQQTNLNQVRADNNRQLVLTSEGEAQLRISRQSIDQYAIRAAEAKPGFFEALDPTATVFVGLGIFYIIAFGSLLTVIFARKSARRTP